MNSHWRVDMFNQRLKKPSGSNPVGILTNLKTIIRVGLFGLWIEFCIKPSVKGGFCVKLCL
jgi:hypothetical protein